MIDLERELARALRPQEAPAGFAERVLRADRSRRARRRTWLAADPSPSSSCPRAGPTSGTSSSSGRKPSSGWPWKWPANASTSPFNA